MQPTPYIDEQTCERLYNARQAAQIVEGVSEATMGHWFAKGFTRYGLKLTVRSEPLMHDRRSGSRNAKTHRTNRLLLAEAEVLQIRSDLHAVGRTKPGQFTEPELDALRGLVYRRRVRALAL